MCTYPRRCPLCTHRTRARLLSFEGWGYRIRRLPFFAGMVDSEAGAAILRRYSDWIDECERVNAEG